MQMEFFNETKKEVNQEYEIYLNINGRALYSNGNNLEKFKSIEKNGKNLLIALKACVSAKVYVEGCYYDVKKQDVFANSQIAKINYYIEISKKYKNCFYLIITSNSNDNI